MNGSSLATESLYGPWQVMAGGIRIPLMALVLSGMLVLVDYASGPLVNVHVLLVVPVALVAWRSLPAAIALSIALVVTRALFELFAWRRPLGANTVLANVLILGVTLKLVALVVSRIARRARLLTAHWYRTLECLPVGVVSTDAHGHVNYANDMARRIGESIAPPTMGDLRYASAALLSEAALEGALSRGVKTLDREVEVSAGHEGERHVLITSTSPVTDDCGEVTGAVVIHEDITERKTLEREREELTRSLGRALAEVKVLKGLLPMCASCGKVRDQEGQWERVETYLAAHSELEVSHSLCGDCAHELYPDYMARAEGDERT